MTTTLRDTPAFRRLTRDGRCGGCGAIVAAYHRDFTDARRFEREDLEALNYEICAVHTNGMDGRAWCVVRREFTTAFDGWRDYRPRNN